MTLSDIYTPGITERELVRRRDEIVDTYLDTMSDAEIAAVQESVAIAHGKRWPHAADMIRRHDPRTSPAVRAQIFALLPSAAQQAEMQQQGGQAR